MYHTRDWGEKIPLWMLKFHLTKFVRDLRELGINPKRRLDRQSKLEWNELERARIFSPFTFH